MPVVAWLVLAFTAVWLERRLVLLSSSWLPRLWPQDIGVAGEARDLGFSFFSPTPPALPDAWAIFFTFLTILVIARRDKRSDSRASKMMNHLMFVAFITWLLWSQLGILSSLPSTGEPLVPPKHELSMLAHIGSMRLSFHAVYLTVLMLAWKTYKAETKTHINILLVCWIVSLCSVVSSRIDFSADVVRGAIFAYIVFFYYSHVHATKQPPRVIAAEKDERRPSRKRSMRRQSRPTPLRSFNEDLLRVNENDEFRRPDVVEAARISEAQRATEEDVKRLRRSYLQLMRQTLVNAIYGDVPIYTIATDWSLAKATKFNCRLRDAGMDVPSIAHCKAGSRRLEHLQKCVEDTLENGVKGDLIDVGAWRGGVGVLLRAILHAHNVHDRRVLLCSSFRGSFSLSFSSKLFLRVIGGLLPTSVSTWLLEKLSRLLPLRGRQQSRRPFLQEEDGQGTGFDAEAEQFPQGNYIQFALEHPDLVEKASEGTNLSQVKQTLKSYGFLDKQVEFYSGDVRHIIPRLTQSMVPGPSSLSLLRLAGGISPDSCAVVLRSLYPRLSKGGFVVVDDYASALGCSATVDAFRDENDIQAPMEWVDHQCISWQKFV